MKTDGSILIDTKIIDGGMEKGFELIKDEMSSIGITAKQVGEQIELSFSKMDVSKPIANAVAKVQQLEQQLTNITSDFQTAVSEGDDKSAERLAAKRVAVYERLEAAREKLSLELAQAVQKEADAEEKATQKKIKAAEKEAAAKKRAQEKQFNDMTKPARRFGSRLREIVSGALVFNVISAGLREVTQYFGAALKSNNEFSTSFAQLRGSLMIAFQPIYEAIVPAIITLVNWLNIAVQAVARFFAALSGKSLSTIQKNAEALNNQASALGGVGGAAKEAAKQLAGFDEINKLSEETSGGGGGGGSSGLPVFDTVAFPTDWESTIDSLAMRVKDIFFTWDNLTPEIIAEKLITALGIVTGGVIGFALGGPGGALIGMTIGAGLGVVLSNFIFDGDGKLSSDELISSLITALNVIGGAAIGFHAGGPLGALIGASVGLLLNFVILKTSFSNNNETKKKVEEKGKQLGGVLKKSFFDTTEENFNKLNETAEDTSDEASDYITKSFEEAERQTETGFIIPTEEEFAAAAQWIQDKFTGAKDWIVSTWVSIPDWFAQNVTEPIAGFFNSLGDEVSRAWDNIVQSVVNAVKDIIAAFGGIFGTVNTYQTTGTIPSVSSYIAAPAVYSGYPDVPMLAKGAVIPPNKKFLAVLGDQRHGRNLEAPEDLIRQIVREESGGGNNDRLAQLLETLISVVEDIEVGDETIGKAAARYNRNTARARGY